MNEEEIFEFLKSPFEELGTGELTGFELRTFPEEKPTVLAQGETSDGRRKLMAFVVGEAENPSRSLPVHTTVVTPAVGLRIGEIEIGEIGERTAAHWARICWQIRCDLNSPYVPTKYSVLEGAKPLAAVQKNLQHSAQKTRPRTQSNGLD